jgi:hypothetical protein
MTPEQYTSNGNVGENEKTLRQIRRSIHCIENRLEHLTEKLELCLEAFAQKEENGFSEKDLYAEDLDNYEL